MNGTNEFSNASAERMRQQGLEEERSQLLVGPEADSKDTNLAVVFTGSAMADWKFLSGAKLPGAPKQLGELLAEALALLGSENIPNRHVIQLGGDGFVFQHGHLRWVCRHDETGKRTIVHGIARARLNPFRKIWRYFDQRKAADLLIRRELYLRRVDLLNDQFEARPTQPMVVAYTAALRHSLGVASPDHLRFYDNIRRALFVCCWQKAEDESSEMWKTYCSDNGGFAIQSTERRLQHEFVKMCEGREVLHFRDIDYVEHATHNPYSHGVPEQAFLKTRQFVNEREIRFAWWHPEAVSGTQVEIEANLQQLPPNRWLPFDLGAATEHITFNPAVSSAQRATLREMLLKQHPAVAERIRRSAFEAI